MVGLEECDREVKVWDRNYRICFFKKPDFIISDQKASSFTFSRYIFQEATCWIWSLLTEISCLLASSAPQRS